MKHKRGATISKPKPVRDVPLLAFSAFAVALTIAFLGPLSGTVLHAATSGLHSYILLVPFITGYLVYLKWNQLPKGSIGSPEWAAVPAVAGVVALGAAWVLHADRPDVSHNDLLTLYVLAFVSWLIAGGFAFMGRDWMKANAFPMGFLIFMVPLPDAMVTGLENGLKLGSAETANLLFNMFGMPVFRDGLVFQLPGVTLEVAQECSGIRSSLVLVITAVLASYLLLNSPWRRFALVALVIPLGILRNGLRILMLGVLAVHFDPELLNGPLHNRSGPVFFALSLIPLLILLWWLRRGERRAACQEGRTVVLQQEG